MKPAAARRAWLIRWLLLWTTARHSPRVTIKDDPGLPLAYELAGHGLEHLAKDLAKLYGMGMLRRAKAGWVTVYWLRDPVAAKTWAKAQPEPEIVYFLEAE